MVEKQESDIIVNKVADSGLITIDLADFLASKEIVFFDIAPWLFRGAILKEQEFREHVKTFDWSQFMNKNIAFGCTNDAIIPVWAYMLLSVAASPFANKFIFGSVDQLKSQLILDGIADLKTSEFTDKRIIVKGCGDIEIPTDAYVQITAKLLPFVKSIMYGEACSNVPVWKKKS